ncbi:MAG: hypothetical protein RIQ59_8 [Bacteroidota bacterium]|jgi:hypothetical protein
MKKIIAISLVVLSNFIGFSQDHFSGISTSSRVGILNGMINPAEYSNLSKKFEVNIYGVSFNTSNNKIGFSDITSGTNLQDLIFKSGESVNLQFDGQIVGPSVAVKLLKWGFAVTTKANIKFDLINIDTNIGNAISNNNLTSAITLLNTNSNQRLIGTSYGEVGFSAARSIIDKEKYSISAGVTFKLLFPGSYSNIGLNGLNGKISQFGGNAYLTTDQPAILNIAYSGSLANNFSNFGDYSKTIFGGLNGMATDIGFNYKLKDGPNKYKVKVGLAFRNIGSMTFKDNNNSSSNYSLNIPNSNPLNLNMFSNANNLGDVETILNTNGYLTKIDGQKDFKVKLPTLFSIYTDIKIVPKVYITGYLQQKLNKDSENDQITALNIVSVTPRLNLGFFETYVPISNNQISGTTVGFGFRLGGFYLGSNSIVSSLTSNGKQADLYTGFRWAFL